MVGLVLKKCWRMKLNSMKYCKKCGRPLGDGAGVSKHSSGISNDKTCTGNCLTKEQVAPPPSPKPKK